MDAKSGSIDPSTHGAERSTQQATIACPKKFTDAV